MGKEDIRAYAQSGGKPKEGTLMRQVYDAIEGGIELDTLISEGTTREQLRAATRSLTYFGYTLTTASLGILPRGKEFSRQMSEAQGGVSNLCMPLLRRGGSIPEVMAITEFSEMQVSNVVTNARRKGKLPKPTQEETRAAKSKSHAGKPRLSHGREFTEDERKRHEIAKRLVINGVITENTTYWDKMREVYRYYNRELPKNFARRIQLEGLLVARLHAEVDDFEVMKAYYHSVQLVDYQTQTGEEEFLNDIILRAIIKRGSS